MKTAPLPIIAALILLIAAPQAHALLDKTFTSSGQILPGEEWNSVYIYNDDTVVDMLDGFVEGLATYDASTVNVIAGHINTLDATDFSTVNVTGGTVDRAGAIESGILNIFGGMITDGMGADYSGTLNMSGGAAPSANFRGQSTANLYGGTISDFLMATEDSTANIFGYDLLLTSSGGSYGYGQATGFWLDDTPFTINLNGADTYSHINLIPEPSSLLLLALGSLLLRRKKIDLCS